MSDDLILEQLRLLRAEVAELRTITIAVSEAVRGFESALVHGPDRFERDHRDLSRER